MDLPLVFISRGSGSSIWQFWLWCSMSTLIWFWASAIYLIFMWNSAIVLSLPFVASPDFSSPFTVFPFTSFPLIMFVFYSSSRPFWDLLYASGMPIMWMVSFESISVCNWLVSSLSPEPVSDDHDEEETEDEEEDESLAKISYSCSDLSCLLSDLLPSKTKVDSCSWFKDLPYKLLSLEPLYSEFSSSLDGLMNVARDFWIGLTTWLALMSILLSDSQLLIILF